MLKNIVCLIFFAAFVCVFADGKTLINLDVSDKKVIGRSIGLLDDKEILRKEAISVAKGEADILVEIDFFYEEDGDSLKVTVTGFPAYFAEAANAANLVSASEISKGDEIKIDAKIDVKSESQISPSVNLPTSAKNDEQKNAQYKSGFYASLKAQSSIPYSSMGANVQFGYFMERVFVGVDFGVGKGDGVEDAPKNANSSDVTHNYYCGSASFGGRIKPNEFFQVIIGGNAGAYTKLYYDYDEKRQTKDYVLAYGPVTKFLFGNTKIKLEVSGKFSIGYDYASINTELGITYAP
ncbi:MAG: hypothetical protein FWF51_08495 [Chitinivibrionia bacterium]|nr:hypothetical protein [Chitinivibrionia bacterium]